MALAGHGSKLSCADSDVAGDEIDGIKSIDFSVDGELLDTTDTMDTTAYHTRILGLKDASIEMSGDYESADTGQARVVTNFLAGTTTWVRYLPNGTTGYKMSGKFESVKIGSPVDGTVSFSATFKTITAVTAV